MSLTESLIKAGRLIKNKCRKFVPQSSKPRKKASFLSAYNNPLFGLLFDIAGSEFRFDGLSAIVPKHLTSRSFRSCFWFELYEAPERRLCHKYLSPDDDVLELGGCLGIVSCKVASLLGPERRHVIIEANSELIPIISTNIRRNGFRSQIVHAAIGGGDRVAFNAATDVIDSSISDEVSNTVSELVETVSADVLEQRYGSFNSLICDIEGAEMHFLAESADFLSRLRVVIIEMHPDILGDANVENCRHFLRESGLRNVEQDQHVEAWVR